MSSRQPQAASGNRNAIASAALALIVRLEPGPKLADMTGTQWRDLILMSLLGMVRHMAEGERQWFGMVLGRQELPWPYYSEDN